MIAGETILRRLLPVKRGQRNRFGYEFKGWEFSPIPEGDSGVLLIDNEKRQVFGRVDLAQRKCPLAALMTGYHECSHFFAGDVYPGLSAESFNRNYEDQEILACRFSEGATMKRIRGDQIKFCIGVHSPETPASCAHPTLGELVESLLEAPNEDVQHLGAWLIREIRKNSAFFGTAAKGQKIGGQPLIPARRKSKPASRTARRGLRTKSARRSSRRTRSVWIRERGVGRVIGELVEMRFDPVIEDGSQARLFESGAGGPGIAGLMVKVNVETGQARAIRVIGK